MSNKRQYYNNRQQSSSPAATSNTGVSTGNGSIPQLVPFVKENGIGPLIQDYNIQVKYHKIYKNLLLFKYDQISSPWEVSKADRPFFPIFIALQKSGNNPKN
jgi:hypothetical protein